jgi:hypothetical protein
MSTIVHCSCGQAINVPATLTHRKARCNKCGAIIRLDGPRGPVTSSDLESLPAATESLGAGEAKNCGDCNKRFLFGQLKRIGNALICTRCCIKRDDAKRRTRGRILKSIAAVIVLVGGGIAFKWWIQPALERYKNSESASNNDRPAKLPARGPDPAKTPGNTPAAIKDAPAPPATPVSPALPGTDLSTFTGANLLTFAPKSNIILLYKQDTRRPPRHQLRGFDLATGREVLLMEMDHILDGMAVSDDGDRLMTVGRTGANPEVRMWDLPNKRVLALAPILESFGRVGIAPDGGAGWCLCPQEGIRYVDAAAATIDLYKGTHVGSAYAQFDAPHRIAAVKCNYGTGGSVVQWLDIFDLDKRRLIHKIDPGDRFGCFALSPDGSLIALGFKDRIDLYDYEPSRRWGRVSTLPRQGMKNAPERALITADNARVIELPFGADGKSPIVREVVGGEARALDAGVCVDWALGPAGDLIVLSEGQAVKRFDIVTGKPR